MTGERSCCYYNKFLWPDRYADCVPMDKVLELIKSVKYREIAGVQRTAVSGAFAA